MSAEQSELPDEDAERSWKERIALVADALSALIRTRLAILREELAAKAVAVAKGAIAAALALGLSVVALLLLAAFLAALLAQWFGNVALGILAAFVLFGAGAGAAVLAARRALTGLKPFEFPAASEELRRDWNAVRESWAPEASLSAETPSAASRPVPAGPVAAGSPREETAESLEERYRAGAE
jgi:hypothetical protein